MNKTFSQVNKDIKLYTVNDAEFAKYGKILDLDCSELISEAEKTDFPSEGSAYVPSMEKFEALPIQKTFSDEIYGEMPIQIGYCYGRNNKLNAFEWHKSSEINVAVTDFVLLLARLEEIKDGYINSSHAKAFYVQKGQCIEVYATSLHFCPCEASNQGFGCVVVLPRGTNLPLEKTYDDRLLFRRNKWLIAHVDNKALIAKGAVPAITGENLTIKTL